MNRIRNLPALIAGIALSAGPVTAGPVYDGPNGSTFNYYGHLNGAFVTVDDGVDTRTVFGDSSHSPSRFGFNIRRPYGDTEFRFNFETALGFPATSAYDNDPTTPDPTFDWTQEDLRKVEFVLGNPAWGRVWAGQGSMASDTTAEVDLSGTFLATYVGVQDTAGRFQFRTGPALSGVSISNAFNQFDGNGRRGRIRYDSPSLAGFTLSASWGTEILVHNADSDFWDVAVAYGNKFGKGTEIQAKLAWFEQDISGTRTDGVTGSASVLLPSGLNFTVASASKGKPSYVYGKIGFKRQFWNVGATAMSVDYYSGNDFGLTGGATSSSSKAWGLGVVQKFSELNLEGYLGYRNYSFDDNVRNYGDLNSIKFGARWKF